MIFMITFEYGEGPVVIRQYDHVTAENFEEADMKAGVGERRFYPGWKAVKVENVLLQIHRHSSANREGREFGGLDA